MSRTLKIDDQYEIIFLNERLEKSYKKSWGTENDEKFYELDEKLRSDLMNQISCFTEFLTSSKDEQRLQLVKKNNKIISSLFNLKVLRKQNLINDDKKFIMEENSDVIINKLLDKINSINNSTNCSKSECTFSMKIWNVCEFFSSKCIKLFSDPTYLNDMSWRIRTQNYREKNKIGLSFYLECNNNLRISNWNCNTKVELRLINQNSNSENLVRSFEHKFDREAPTFGYKFFISWIDIFESKRGFIKDDSILLEVYLKLI